MFLSNFVFFFQGQAHAHKITGNVWSLVYHKFLGLCHTFKLSQAENIEIEGSAKLSFWLKPILEVLERGIHGKIFLHSGKDLPNAGEHSSLLEFYPEQNNYTQYPGLDNFLNLGTYWQVKYTIAKENIKIEPSKKNPCGDLYPESCYDFQLNKFIQEKSNCHIPL